MGFFNLHGASACRQWLSALLMCLLLSVLLPFTPPAGEAWAQKPKEVVANSELSAAETQQLLELLQNDSKRQELIKQLQLLEKAQSATEQEPAPTVVALGAVKQRLEALQTFNHKVWTNLKASADLIPWLQQQWGTTAKRQAWLRGSAFFLIIVLSSHLAAWLCRRLLGAWRQRQQASATDAPHRHLAPWQNFAGQLLPIGVFLAVGYGLCGFLPTAGPVRLVALAWIHAFSISGLCLALFALLWGLDHRPGLLTISEDNRHRLRISLCRPLRFAIYGFFALEAARLLGVPHPLHTALLKLWGLLLSLLVLQLLFKQRVPVRQALLKALDPDTKHWGSLGQYLCLYWHWPIAVYVAGLYLVWALRVPQGFAFMSKATLLSLLVLLALHVLLRSLHRPESQELAIPESWQRALPDIEQRLHRYRQLTRKLLFGTLWTLAILVILQIWQLNLLSWLLSAQGRPLLLTLIRAAAIIVMGIIVWQLATMFITAYLTKEENTLGEINPRSQTLLTLAQKGLAILLVIVIGLMTLAELGINIAPLLAGAGVLGLAVGFGAQKLVQDVITGVFILLEDQVSVNDVVTMGDKTGVVEAVSLRTVTLRDLSANVHTIPYSSISTVSNFTKNYSYYLLNVGVAYREDTDEITAVLQELGREMEQDREYGSSLLGPEALEILGVDAFADSAVYIKGRLKTRPGKQWWVGREFNRRMKKRFDELNIEIPFPHQTIYFGENKEGQAPPAHIALQQSPSAEIPEAGS